MTGSTSSRTSYRHGSLGPALVEAGVALAREGGPQAVQLREATRRVGVSATAAYRHFDDHRALLHAVGVVAMAQLAREMEAQQDRVRAADPREAALARLRGVGAGYLRYARDEPGLFRTAFAVTEQVGEEPAARGDTGLTPLQLLTRSLDEIVAVGLMPPERRPDAELMAWSAVHGLSMLLIDGPLAGLDAAHADAVVQQLLDHVASGLLAPLDAPGR